MEATTIQDTDVLLTVSNVSKEYISRKGTVVRAVEDVSFTVRRGEFVAIVGPSGCGKTTLMKMSAGLVPITSGVIDYDGTGRPTATGAYGMVFQSACLLPWRTIAKNVTLPADILGLPKKEADARALQLLDLVGLGGRESQYPGELSGGMQQRGAIARALLADPDILFMDEPFGALDAITRTEMNLELQRIHMHEHKTVVFITHSLDEAVLLADRVIVMSKNPGRITREVPIPLQRPRSPEDLSSPEFRELELELREALEAV